MILAEHKSLVRSYDEGCGALSHALELFQPGELDSAPVGEWTARQVVHHVADAEVLRSAQLRTLLAGQRVARTSVRPGPLLARYVRPVEASLSVLRASVESNLALLNCLSEGDWAGPRAGRETAPFTVDEWLRRAADHAHEHAGQLRSLLELIRV